MINDLSLRKLNSLNLLPRQYFLPLGWALFILFATLASTSVLVSLNLSDLFSYDKPIHAFLFAMQAWLLVRARLYSPMVHYKRNIISLCLLSLIYGVLIEILQEAITSSRMFDMYDAFADGVGCMITGFFCLINPVKSRD